MKTKKAGLPIDYIESTPEWKACFGLIDGDEYLRLTAHYLPETLHTDEYRHRRADGIRKGIERRAAANHNEVLPPSRADQR